MKRISIAISLISILFCSAILTRALHEDEPEFGYDEDSPNGPEYWGDIKEAWAACKTGQMQSPIDLSRNVVQLIPKAGGLKYWTYNPQYATLSNRGHDVAVDLRGDAGSIDIDGSSFFLQQIHWHWPSEHTIDGRRLISLHNHFFSVKENEEESVTEIDPSEIMSGKMFYRYIGSLTAPPCTEGIIWTIDKEIRTVSIGQVELLKNSVLIPYAPRNARPLQPLNQRSVRLYVNKPLY
ncbi:alpha carbonic anhydrase 7-like [Vigna umbellata]|uniref:alpha carbonic anhydrase 7-like n=1 Tax=Vigna umbellata TaxID=87088 RepID=UPI001F5E3978|nr:alpha carbonic anhydrase 7-like [Vigna umbellata]